MAPYYAAILSVSAVLIAEQSSTRKLAKYSELAISHIFLSIAMESFDPICAEALIFLSELYVQKHSFFLVNLDVAYL